MKAFHSPFLLCAASLAFFLAVPGGLRADEAAASAKLREALKSVTLQLRALQEQNATLQAAKDASDLAAKGLQDKLDADAKQAKADREAAEAEQAKLASRIIVLQRQLDTAITRNLALFKLGNEILTRYEHFGLGDALAAKEPFTQNARVKLENFVQEYQDKLGEQRVVSGRIPAGEAPAPLPAPDTTASNTPAPAEAKGASSEAAPVPPATPSTPNSK